MLGDGFQGLGSLLLFFRSFLRCLSHLRSILRILLRIEKLLVGLFHRLLYRIDHAQCSIGILGSLQLRIVENVLLGGQLQKRLLQLIDALFDLLLLLGVLLRSGFGILCLLL